MSSQSMISSGDFSSRPGSRLLRLTVLGTILCAAGVWCLGPARSASGAVLQSMSLNSQVQVNFEGATSDLLDEVVSGAFDKSLSVSVPSPEGNGQASANSYLTGSALDTGLTLSAGGSIGNFEAAGGSSAISRVSASAVYVIDVPTPFTLQVPGGVVDTGEVGVFGSSAVAFVDAGGNAIAATAPGVGNTTAKFAYNSGSGFSNLDGSFPTGAILSGMLDPGTYTLHYDGEIFGTGFGGFSVSNLVLTVPEPSTVMLFGLAGALLTCRRRRSARGI